MLTLKSLLNGLSEKKINEVVDENLKGGWGPKSCPPGHHHDSKSKSSKSKSSKSKKSKKRKKKYKYKGKSKSS